MQTQTTTDALIASLPAKVRALLNLKGQIVTMQIGREMKMRKGYAPIYKFSHIQCRVGVNYDNIANVIAKREDGTLPAENAGRAWGKYVVFPYVVEHKGQLYFHFSTIKTSFNSEVNYVRNGKMVSIEDAKVACLASEFAEKDLDCFDLKVESILSINGKEVV